MNKPLILVVEDDRSVNNLITTILKTHDYRYLTALNGAEAVLEASSHNPDMEHEEFHPLAKWEDFIADPGRYLNGMIEGEFEE